MDEALRRGHQVTAVSRGGPVAASLYDRDTVVRLAADADVLVSAITSGPDATGNTLPDVVPTLVAAAKNCGVRIGMVGGAGSLLLDAGGEQVVARLAAVAPPDKLRDIELHVDFLELLRRTPDDVDWFYLSPPTGFGAHMPGVRRGYYRVGSDILLADGEGNSEISGEDYAAAFVDEIEQPRHHRRRFTVAY